MTPGVHRVRRQSWGVAVRSAEEAFATRVRLRVALEHELPAALGRAFDRVAPGAAIVHIPRLELRLRVPRLDALAGALEEAIERELRLQPPQAAREAAIDRLQVLLDYLDTGILAWHAAQDDPMAVAAELRATLLDNLEVVARRGPAPDTSFGAAVLFYFRLLALLPEEKWPLLALSPFASLAEALDARAAAAVIAAVFPEGVNVEQASAEALRLLQLSPRAAISALTAMRASRAREVQRIAAWVLAAARAPDAAFREEANAAAAAAVFPTDRYGGAVRITDGAPITTPVAEEPWATAFAAPASSGRDAAPAVALMAGNAGLVLLHPFLPALFKVCSIHRPPEPLAVERAAALLYWLATGREEVHEFELGFVKLLVGLRPETPLAPSAGLLGAREREEGEALLAAVIGHWKTLGRTSIDGLRVAFLQRRGALHEEEAGWRLQLEPESFDVLLGHLPWSFATVKLPWMTQPLFTDWPTP